MDLGCLCYYKFVIYKLASIPICILNSYNTNNMFSYTENHHLCCIRVACRNSRFHCIYYDFRQQLCHHHHHIAAWRLHYRRLHLLTSRLTASSNKIAWAVRDRRLSHGLLLKSSARCTNFFEQMKGVRWTRSDASEIYYAVICSDFNAPVLNAFVILFMRASSFCMQTFTDILHGVGVMR